MWNVLLIFMIRSGSPEGQRIFVLAVQTSVVHWAIVDVFIVIVSVVVAVLDLVMSIVKCGVVENSLWHMRMRVIESKIVVHFVMVSISIGLGCKNVICCIVVVGIANSVPV